MVEGMADIYQTWHKAGAGFIYLTNSPYQLYEPLNQFLQKSYPEGAYYLRRIDWKTVQQSIDKLIAADEDIGTKENPKKHNLIPILERFPGRKFILIGV
jgi:phosphatidate phosphatase APP1